MLGLGLLCVVFVICKLGLGVVFVGCL